MYFENVCCYVFELKNAPIVFSYEQEIAEWFPKRKVNLPDGCEDVFRIGKYVLDGRGYNKLQEHFQWKDQCQVARWATLAVKPGWKIHVMTDATKVPLYYFILDDGNMEMKGVWRSLYGSVSRLITGKIVHPPHTSVIHLLQWALSIYNKDILVRVQARIGLLKLFEKYRVPIQHISSPPKTSGGSVPSQFYIGDLTDYKHATKRVKKK